jgi:hypothetical protein
MSNVWFPKKPGDTINSPILDYMSSTPCKYCGGNEVAHGSSCPTVAANGSIKEWEKGYERGYNDDVIQNHSLSFYTHAFQIGYRKGKADIDCECDAAFQGQISYERSS